MIIKQDGLVYSPDIMDKIVTQEDCLRNHNIMTQELNKLSGKVDKIDVKMDGLKTEFSSIKETIATYGERQNNNIDRMNRLEKTSFRLVLAVAGSIFAVMVQIIFFLASMLFK